MTNDEAALVICLDCGTVRALKLLGHDSHGVAKTTKRFPLCGVCKGDKASLLTTGVDSCTSWNGWEVDNDRWSKYLRD